MAQLRLPVSPEECPEPEWGPGQHRFRFYRMRSGHVLTVEFPGPAWHPKMGATTPVHPVIGAVAWRWIALGQPWREIAREEMDKVGRLEKSAQEKAIDRGFEIFKKGGGTLLDLDQG